MNEKDYTLGYTAAMRLVLGRAMTALGAGPDVEKAAVVAELHDVRAALRDICERHGDNDWADDLHLGDVLNKHLATHLDDPARRRRKATPSPEVKL